MTVYLDSDNKCHVTETEGLREFDVPFFDGKCKAFIEGYRYVPEGETWTRSDGVEFAGEMISPLKDYNILAAAQAQYELDSAELETTMLAELDAAFVEGVNSV